MIFLNDIYSFVSLTVMQIFKYNSQNQTELLGNTLRHYHPNKQTREWKNYLLRCVSLSATFARAESSGKLTHLQLLLDFLD